MQRKKVQTAILFVSFFSPSGGNKIGHIISKGFSISGFSEFFDEEADRWAWDLDLMMLGIIDSRTLVQSLLSN